MAAKTQKSSIGAKLAKYGVKSVHAEHKDDEIIISAGGDLPAGIEDGIAEISTCYIGEYGPETKHPGEPFFRASAVVVSPEEFKNRTTTIQGPLCDTPEKTGKKRTFEDHYSWMLNELKKMGAQESIEAMVDPESELEGVMAAIASSGIFIKFRTWSGPVATEGPYKGKPPMVSHDWRGTIEYTPSESDDDGVTVAEDDEKPAVAAKKTVASKTAPATAAPAKKAVKGAVKAPSYDDMELSEVVALANGDDTAAQKWLIEKAVEAGIDSDEAEAQETWDAVGELITSAATGESDDGSEGVDLEALGAAADEEMNAGEEGENTTQIKELAAEAGLDPDSFSTYSELATALIEAGGEVEAVEEEAAEAVEPAVGEVHLYKWFDVKTKKRATKAIECEVMAVDKKKQTVKLKNLTNKQLADGIPFSALE